MIVANPFKSPGRTRGKARPKGLNGRHPCGLWTKKTGRAEIGEGEAGVIDGQDRVGEGMPPPTGTTVSREYFEHIRKINDVFAEQIVISDQKAAYIFTFMLAFLVSSSEGREVFTWGRYTHGTMQGIAFSGMLAASSIVSMIAAILVVLPLHVKKSTSLFWGTWGRHRPLFEDAARRRDPDYLFNQYLDNADILSFIARRKYRNVTYAFRALVVTVLSYVLLLVAG